MSSAPGEKLAILNAELDRRLGDVGQRLGDSGTRAGIVIAAALVIATIAVSGQHRGLPLVLAGSSALLAGLASLTYRQARDVPISAYIPDLPNHTVKSLSEQVFDTKMTLLYAEEHTMTVRARQLTLSYAYLMLAVISVALVGLHAF